MNFFLSHSQLASALCHIIGTCVTKAWYWTLRFLVVLSFVLPVGLPTSVQEAEAARGDRTLYLYYTHTRETAKIRFRKNGKYDKAGLKKLNYFLRDWRRNEPTKMDPRLFDLLWAVYQEVGAKKPIHVVSAYRSPKTNKMLRSRSRGVAKNSQHTKGKAMDFFIPGVPLSKLRAAGLRMGVGGVGYYPRSGSPFVHMDTGRVRHWPRMTRKQLVKVFPRGKTLHVPTDGKPLKGYDVALANYKRSQGQVINTLSGRSGERSSGGGLFGLGRKKQNSAPVAAPKPAPAPRKPAVQQPVLVKATPDIPREAIEQQEQQTFSAPINVASVPLPKRSPWKSGNEQPVTEPAAVAAPLLVADATGPLPKSRPSEWSGVQVASANTAETAPETTQQAATETPATPAPTIVTARLNIPEEADEKVADPTALVLAQNGTAATEPSLLQDATLAYAAPIPAPREGTVGTDIQSEELAAPLPLTPAIPRAATELRTASNDVVDSRFVVASIAPDKVTPALADRLQKFAQKNAHKSDAKAAQEPVVTLTPKVPAPRPNITAPTTETNTAVATKSDPFETPVAVKTDPATAEQQPEIAIANAAPTPKPRSLFNRFAGLFGDSNPPVPVKKEQGLAQVAALPAPKPATATSDIAKAPAPTSKPQVKVAAAPKKVQPDPLAKLVYNGSSRDAARRLVAKSSTRQWQFASLTMPDPNAETALLQQPQRAYKKAFLPRGVKPRRLTPDRFTGRGNARVEMTSFDASGNASFRVSSLN